MHRDIEKEKPVTMAMATKRMVKQVDGWMIPNAQKMLRTKTKNQRKCASMPKLSRFVTMET